MPFRAAVVHKTKKILIPLDKKQFLCHNRALTWRKIMNLFEAWIDVPGSIIKVRYSAWTHDQVWAMARAQYGHDKVHAVQQVIEY
jgi:hypothetical protein